MSHVIWHDVECGSYDADLPLWRELAAACGGPILDVGAGTGRVALHLARLGHEVVALDCDAALLEELDRRAVGLPVQTVVDDATAFSLPGRRFPLIIAPMQTVQLLQRGGREGFLRCAREHVAPGGLVACALADAVEPFDAQYVILPPPDVLVVGGVHYASQPVALRDVGDRFAIERVREILRADGSRSSIPDTIYLDRIQPALLEFEGRLANLVPERPRIISATDDHVGSSVVMLRG